MALITADDNYAVRSALEKGHLEVVKYIVDILLKNKN